VKDFRNLAFDLHAGHPFVDSETKSR
jgi:hypothetical protein